MVNEETDTEKNTWIGLRVTHVGTESVELNI